MVAAAATESASILRSRKQVVTMLVTVVVFFFACMMPFKVLTLWITASPVEVFDVIDNETYYILVYFSRVMFYINSAINPILYNIMSSKFREGFRRVFYCVNWPLTPRRLRLSTTSNRAQSSTTTGITWFKKLGFKKDTHDFRKTLFLLLVSYYKLNKTMWHQIDF